MVTAYTESGRPRERSWRRLVRGGLAVVIAVSGMMLAQPSQAVAEPVSYLETNCVIKSFAANGGLHGDGCTTWGVPYVVTIGAPQASPLPPEILQPIIGCAQNGMIELVKAWTEVDKTIPPTYKKAASGAYFAMGCVQGIGEAMADLGIH